MLIKILDLDLDFFVEEIFFNALSESNVRIHGDKHKPWAKEKVADDLNSLLV